MGKGKWQTASISAVLTFLAVYGGLGCMASGMELSVDGTLLLLGCAVMALLLSFCWDSRLWLLPLCLAALLLGYWWQEDTLRLSMEGLIYQITDLYDRGYGWGILQWTDRNLLRQDVTPALLALGVPIAAVVSLTTVKGRFGWLGVGMALLPMLSTALLKDTVPAEEYLALLLFSSILILMTGHLRRSSHRQANSLTLTLALPLTLALALLFTFCPQEGYHMQSGAQKLEDWVLALFRQAELPEGLALIPGDQASTVELADVGKRVNGKDVIMTVRAQETGTIYLRGCAYDIYDGTSWSSTPGWNSWNLFYSSGSNDVKSLTVQTRNTHSVLYFTYSPYNTPQKVLGGRMRNENGLTEYTVHYRDPITYGAEWDQREDAIGGQELAEYLLLPDSTREGALQILTKKVGVPTETINAGQIWKNAIYITEWVSRRADYDLDTGKMPASEEDFALWFLNEADTGYCTHYATAAVVLLRAAGIPAQYVTGYLVEAKEGQSVAVTEANAHAWVEVFINGVGWVVLEPTPSDGVVETVGGSEGPTVSSRPTTPDDPTETKPTAGSTEPEHTHTETEPEPATEATADTNPPGETTEPLSHPTATVTGIAGIGGAGGGAPGNPRMEKAVLWLIIGTAALLLVLAQWRIRVAIKRKQCRRGQPNRRALQMWKQLALVCKLLRQPPAEDAFQLAQKAKFSQHTLTAQELQTLKQTLTEATGLLRKRSILLQPVYTLILAIY